MNSYAETKSTQTDHSVAAILHSERFKLSIEKHYQQWKTTNALSLKSLNGSLSRNQVLRYLENILFIIKHTPEFLKLALEMATLADDSKMIAFFKDKIGEEQGHDQWAENDIEKISAAAPVAQENINKDVSPYMIILRNHVKKNILTFYPRYLSYIMFAEYFTVLAVPEWIKNLQNFCGIQIDSLTVLSNHAELDKEHVLEDFSVINQLNLSAGELDEMERSLHEEMSLFDKFCDDVANASI